MEAEVESEDPIELGDDASSSKDKVDWDAAATSTEPHGPTATPISSEHGAGVHSDALESRKHATSEDTTCDSEAKQAWSPCPLDAPPSPQPPAPSTTEHASRSGERDRLQVPSGSVRVPSPQ